MKAYFACASTAKTGRMGTRSPVQSVCVNLAVFIYRLEIHPKKLDSTFWKEPGPAHIALLEPSACSVACFGTFLPEETVILHADLPQPFSRSMIL